MNPGRWPGPAGFPLSVTSIRMSLPQTATSTVARAPGACLTTLVSASLNDPVDRKLQRRGKLAAKVRHPQLDRRPGRPDRLRQLLQVGEPGRRRQFGVPDAPAAIAIADTDSGLGSHEPTRYALTPSSTITGGVTMPLVAANVARPVHAAKTTTTGHWRHLEKARLRQASCGTALPTPPTLPSASAQRISPQNDGSPAPACPRFPVRGRPDRCPAGRRVGQVRHTGAFRAAGQRRAT
jgi:hypothetical protein